MANLELRSKVASKVRRYEAAKQALIEAAAAEQQSCKHEFCWELPWRSATYFGARMPRRICVHCRYEEKGSNWSGGSGGVWSRHDYSEAILAHSIVVKTLSEDEFYSKRLPVRIEDWHPSAIAERDRLEEERKAREQRERDECCY